MVFFTYHHIAYNYRIVFFFWGGGEFFVDVKNYDTRVPPVQSDLGG